MSRSIFFALGLAMVGTVFAPTIPRAQPIDSWHYITADSVLFTDEVAGLQGAGVIQSDEVFALLYLGPPEENGLVSVILPTRSRLEELTSILIASNGQQFERALSPEEIDASRIDYDDHAYSFPISDADVDLFKSARTWQLRSGDQTWDITLSGSRRAIEMAEAERARLFSELKNEAVPTD